MRRALFLFGTDQMSGAERITRSLVKEVAVSQRFDQIICCILTGSRSGTLDELLPLGNVSLHYTSSRTQLGGILTCINIMRRHHYELVFSSLTALNTLSSLMRFLRVLRTARLVTRESTMAFDRDFGWRTHLVRALYRAYGAQDLLICQTERMRESLNAHTSMRLQHKCIVLGNPIELDRITSQAQHAPPDIVLSVPSDRRKIIWCGRLIPVKAPLRAIEALRYVHDAGCREAHLVMVGSGALEQDARAAARQLGITEHVTFVGFCENPASIMARSELGLVTSDVEGFPNVVLEMLATGVRRVVTTNCAGGLSELAQVEVAPTPDAQTLASLLIAALEASAQGRAAPPLQLPTPRTYLNALGVI